MIDVGAIAKQTMDRWPDGTGEHWETMLVRAGVLVGMREAERMVIASECLSRPGIANEISNAAAAYQSEV